MTASRSVEQCAAVYRTPFDGAPGRVNAAARSPPRSPCASHPDSLPHQGRTATARGHWPRAATRSVRRVCINCAMAARTMADLVAEILSFRNGSSFGTTFVPSAFEPMRDVHRRFFRRRPGVAGRTIADGEESIRIDTRNAARVDRAREARPPDLPARAEREWVERRQQHRRMRATAERGVGRRHRLTVPVQLRRLRRRV